MIRRFLRAAFRRLVQRVFAALPIQLQMELALDWVKNSGWYDVTPKRAKPWPAGVVELTRFAQSPRRR